MRLRWLLNALSDQTIQPPRFQVVIVDGSSGDETARLLADHPLAATGALRAVHAPTAARVGERRNLGWRAAAAPLVLFTDDDCRPPADWLERTLAAATRHPGAVIQGRTIPDPDEAHLLDHAPHARSQRIDPPSVWAQTCNILYPRALLERMDGFDPALPGAIGGEDTDLALRAIASGAEYRGAPEVLTYHAVLDGTLRERIRGAARWQDLPFTVKRHPQLRSQLPLGYFWKPRHAWLPLAIAGVALQRRSRLAPLLMVPWAIHAAPDHTPSPRGRLRSLLELPGRAVIDLAEIAALARGSVRHRTLLL